MLTWLESREIARRTRSASPAGPRPRPDLPPGTDLPPQIRHIVVLMMENHSHDNYLGMLSGRGDGFRLGPDGLPTARWTWRASRPSSPRRSCPRRAGPGAPKGQESVQLMIKHLCRPDLLDVDWVSPWTAAG